MEEFRRVLAEELPDANLTNSVEEIWIRFKEALRKTRSCLPLVTESEEKDWVTDEVREVSRRKQEAWMRWVKSPSSSHLEEYQELKVLSRRCADKACEVWWEARAEEAEKLHEAAVRQGHGGSLLRELKLLRCRQKLKADSMLLAQDGTQLHSVVDKLERWREHFAQVGNVSVEVAEGVLSSVLESVPLSAPVSNVIDGLSSVPKECEIRAALGRMKNGRAPGADDISAELLKPGGEKVVQWLSHLAQIVWEEERYQRTG